MSTKEKISDRSSEQVEANALSRQPGSEAEIVETISVESKLKQMTTEHLRAELHAAFAQTAEGLARMAAIVKVLEERGEDLSDLRYGWLTYIRAIARGKLLPEAIVRFATFPLLLTKIGNLPLPDQQKLASGEPVEMAIGVDDHIRVDPLKLSAEQVRIVFAPDHIRSLQEQSEVIALRVRVSDKIRKKFSPGKVRANASRGGLIVNRTFVPLAEVLQALAEMREQYDEDSSSDIKQILFAASEDEHQRLKILSAQSNVSMSSLIRRALYAAGIFSSPDRGENS